MATRKFSVQDVVATVCDSDFGFSDADSSRVEDGEDIYAYLGDSIIDRQSLHEESRRLTSDDGKKKNVSDEEESYGAENVSQSSELIEEDPEVPVEVPALTTGGNVC